MNNVSASQPLTARLERMTPEGRVAWHVARAVVAVPANRKVA